MSELYKFSIWYWMLVVEVYIWVLGFLIDLKYGIPMNYIVYSIFYMVTSSISTWIYLNDFQLNLFGGTVYTQVGNKRIYLKRKK